MRNKNALKNEVTIGLAGFGKSYSLAEKIEKKIDQKILKPNQVQLLVFNKELQLKSVERNRKIFSSNISTVHAFAYNILEQENLLPTIFNTSIICNGWIKSIKYISSSDYDRLIIDVINLDPAKFRKYVKHIDLLVIDEYQDFREDYLLLVKKIIQEADCKVWIGYGEYQTIYFYQNKKSTYKLHNNLISIEKDLGIKIANYNMLKKNYRQKNPLISEFIYKYIINAYGKESSKYIPSDKIIDSKFKYKRPIIRLFNHHMKETDYIVNEIKKYNNKRIVILGRWKRDLTLINLKLESVTTTNNITVSSIHKIKGLEADIVFVTGFDIESEQADFLDLLEMKNLYYVAFSRPRDRLYITTSYPINNGIKYLPLEVCEYINSRKKPVKKYSLLPKIKPSANFTKKKLQNNTIDSICLKVNLIDAPYMKYVNKSQTAQDNYMSKQVIEHDGLRFDIRFHHKHKNYYFSFLDIHLLKKSSFSDTQILLFLRNYVIEYFDHRISPDSIKVHRLDLNEYFFLKSEEEKTEFLSRGMTKYQTSSAKSLREKYGKINYLTDRAAIYDFKKSVYYANFMKRKQDSITSGLYSQDIKLDKHTTYDKSNIVHIPHVCKRELRLKGTSISRKYILGDNYLTTLLNYSKTNSLKELIKQVHSYKKLGVV